MRTSLVQYRGLRTQQEMAQLYNVTQQTWSNWENGNCIPSPLVMKQIEVNSGTSMFELFKDYFNKNNLSSSKMQLIK